MGAAKFAILPEIPPVVPILMTLVGMFPVLLALWRKPHPVFFIRAVTYSALTRFARLKPSFASLNVGHALQNYAPHSRCSRFGEPAFG